MMRPWKSLLMVLIIIGVAASVAAVVVNRSRPTLSHLGVAHESTRQANPRIGAEIDALMRDCVQGKPHGESAAYMGGGWRMTLPSGVEIDRNGLQILFAAPIIEYGPEAVPHLLKWAMNDNRAIRYIAVYSLEQITGVKSKVGYFQSRNADHRWERAIDAWKRWWEDQDQ
jgi:hypothetical protein